MKTPDITVLVLAGGSLESKNLGPGKPLINHPILLPSGSKLAYENISLFYKKAKIKSKLAAVIDRPLPRTIPIRFLDSGNTFLLSPQRTIIGTISKALEKINTKWIVINPITTLPTKEPEFKNQVYVSDQQMIREDWSAFREDKKGMLEIEGKNARHDLSLSTPFTGIISCQKALLVKAIKNIDQKESEDLIDLVEELMKIDSIELIKTGWRDLGHRATHAISRRSQLPCREFNKISYCNKRDVIVKSSSDIARLDSEKQYLANIPSQLKHYFPYVFEKKSNKVELIMEAIPFPSLAELFLHWDLGPNSWSNILERLFLIQEDFVMNSRILSGSSDWLYSEKLKSRWKSLKQISHTYSDYTKELCSKPLTINGITYTKLDAVISKLTNALKELETDSKFQLIHGDFCFNNILCEPLYTKIKLIDPRGELSQNNNLPRGYGDSRYDLIKLYHSIGCSYDAIVNNMFNIKWDAPYNLNIEIYRPSHENFIVRKFNELTYNLIKKKDLHLLTSSLFFSMLPLHREDSDRQIALAYCGLRLLSEIDFI